MPMSSQRLILGFDFGTRRIGVAVGNELTRSARALDPLPARDGIPDWTRVARLVDEWRPDLFVVGLPLNMDGTESDMSTRARKFGKRLFGRYGIPCEMADERGSTREAKAIARDAGHRGNYRDDGVDGLAAVLILEGWLADQEGLP
ncbi:Holliday junction resolvase RuvX [Halomonas elongata]|uniref:Putative pre-16S rRNA nuclease n=3 Tax=Halomonas elongata TaxID=2746 RepID=A0ABZ0T8K7_HALED|nr:Holliday junction resolvase RuvX [Halomonas elongata]MBW5800380.1 Holliday junction resolvase RuvX [Halomonas elongata]MDL4861821.1 Holliday junction resolvase RuvX [Halomonas elongata]WBF18184.1 Holliday junction resolvase RuvX [Halomonas elongata]WPU47035.1 Holliday junction resolvase RuvX [Halomonas elongata DSM 2581]WVI71716.1 Holliday junction resolvase RuvX [Halomonas elongata]